MEFTGRHTFEAPVERVWEMFQDKDAHLAKFESMGHRDIEVLEHDLNDDRFRLVVSRSVTVELPGFARKVLQPTNTVVSTDVWEDKGDGTYGGSFTVETPGAPIHSKGRTALRSDGAERTAYEVHVELTVKVPIIGGKIANWAKGDVEKQLTMEFDAGDAWLAEHG